MIVEYLDGTYVVCCDTCAAPIASYDEPVVMLDEFAPMVCQRCRNESWDVDLGRISQSFLERADSDGRIVI